MNRIAAWGGGLAVDPDHFGHPDPLVPITVRVGENQIAGAGFEGIREPAPMAFTPHEEFTGMFTMETVQALRR